MNTELVVPNGGPALPAMTIQEAVERRQLLVEFTRRIMQDGVDYGAVPGTDKPTLLKPGAEKLCTFFNLVPVLECVEEVKDWTGAEHGGEPFFYFRYRCTLLTRSGSQVCVADGSCNSWESKYRWRKAERICPHCKASAIIRGKAQYGGGWICFERRGGCGARFKAGDAQIEQQVVGRVPNPDVFDQVNTIQKMASKRALVAAVLLGVNASEFFTQDVEDIVEVAPQQVDRDTGEIQEPEPEAPAQNGGAGSAQAGGEMTGVERMVRRGLIDDLQKALREIGITGSQEVTSWLNFHFPGKEKVAQLSTTELAEAVKLAVDEASTPEASLELTANEEVSG